LDGGSITEAALVGVVVTAMSVFASILEFVEPFGRGYHPL
jgi:hypothetical protein